MKTVFPHMNKVDGWLNLNALLFTSYYVDQHLKANSFDAIEIGVHHGKYFIGIENLVPESGTCYAVDLFNQQDKNIDGSGKGALDIFNNHVENFAAYPCRVTTIEKDSFDLDLNEFGLNKFGVISIDGGHTCEHTINDLQLAQQLLSSDGIVILDDILNQDWMGDVTGAVRFFSSELSTKLVPFAVGFNKLFCCHFSVFDKVQNQIIQDKAILENVGIRYHKMTPFSNRIIFSFHGK